MIALTIGVFDGVHRGHQLLLRSLKETKTKTAVLTFSNHPSIVLKNAAPPLLTSLPLKMALLKDHGADEIIEVPFTHATKDQGFEEFLKPYPIRHLILGEDAAFGKACQGTPEALQRLGEQRNFDVHVQPLLQIAKKPLSSSRIRTLIANGQLNEAKKLLGRPYCILFLPSSTMPHLVLPPDGQYHVWLHSFEGIRETTLRIEKRIIEPFTSDPQLISFGQNLNPLLFSHSIDFHTKFRR